MCIICEDMVINWSLLIVITATVLGFLIGSYYAGKVEDGEGEVAAWAIIGGLTVGFVVGILLAVSPWFTLGSGVACILAYGAFRLGERRRQ